MAWQLSKPFGSLRSKAKCPWSLPDLGPSLPLVGKVLSGCQEVQNGRHSQGSWWWKPQVPSLQISMYHISFYGTRHHSMVLPPSKLMPSHPPVANIIWAYEMRVIHIFILKYIRLYPHNKMTIACLALTQTFTHLLRQSPPLSYHVSSCSPCWLGFFQATAQVLFKLMRMSCSTWRIYTELKIRGRLFVCVNLCTARCSPRKGTSPFLPSMQPESSWSALPPRTC